MPAGAKPGAVILLHVPEKMQQDGTVLATDVTLLRAPPGEEGHPPRPPRPVRRVTPLAPLVR